MISLDTKLALLQALIQGPSYGLELIDRVRSRTRGQITIKQASVYPALRELEQEGLLESYEGEPLPIRNGRPRVYYRLTAAGERTAQQQARAVFALLKPALGEI
jgi:DNA-binding PadR family transcriptional regulator